MILSRYKHIIENLIIFIFLSSPSKNDTILVANPSLLSVVCHEYFDSWPRHHHYFRQQWYLLRV